MSAHLLAAARLGDLELDRLPLDVDAFASELYEFCPDLIDQGFESLSALAAHLP